MQLPLLLPFLALAASSHPLSRCVDPDEDAYKLPELPHPYDALEPYISEDLLKPHHDRHHATYIMNLNAAVPTLSKSIADMNATGIIAAQEAGKFNGGGHVNHALFWPGLKTKDSEKKARERGRRGRRGGELEKTVNAK